MSIALGIETKLPGDRNIDLFPKPDIDINSDEFGYASAVFNFNSTVTLSSDEIPVRNTDLLLTHILKIFGPILGNDLNRNTKALKSSNRLVQEMLSYIKVFDAKYTGPISPTSDYSCFMLASQLKDRYNTKTRNLIRNNFIENDYFGVIAFEVSKGRTLIGFDKNWILPAIANYIENKITYEMEDTVALRERIATYNPENSIIEWDQIPKPRGELFSLTDLTIYPFHDSTFTKTDGCQSEVYMIFAPVSRDEAEKIYLYLYRDVELYSDIHQITLKNVSPERVKDFQYLFPVDLKHISNYTIISTDKMSRDKLEHIYEYDEIPFEFSRLTDLTGAHAAYLLAESLFFEYSLRWENNILYVGLCGYIQAFDIIEQFSRVLNDIEKESPYYKELPNFSTAANSGVKCIYHNGKYYAVLRENREIPIINQSSSIDITKAELINPLMKIDRGYLQALGYNTDPNPEPYFNDGVSLGYRTYQIDDSVITVYYYASTNSSEIDLHEIHGLHNEEVFLRLELLLRNGYFFTQKTKNITQGYPEFIPSDPPILPQLSTDPSRLIVELDNLIRGTHIRV